MPLIHAMKVVFSQRSFSLHSVIKNIFAGTIIMSGVLPAMASSPLPTTTSLIVSTTSTTPGAVVTYTATVTDSNNNPVTSGTVLFCNANAVHCEDVAILAAAQLSSNGATSVSLRPKPGTDSVNAVFVGTTTDSTSTSSTQTVIVSGMMPTTASLAATGSAGNYTLTATIGGAASSGPTGTVSFEDTSNGNAVLATSTLESATQGTTFQPYVTYATGSEPYGSVAGDFNGDGILDLAVTNKSSNTVGILLGNADGTFQAQQTYATDSSPENLISGDFNNDGHLDLVTVTTANNILDIFLGNGDGTFQTKQTYSLETSNLYGIAVGDFNTDGKLDLVVTFDNTSGTASVLLGNGDGTFQGQQVYSAGTQPIGVAVGDFNRDGYPDFATANYGDSSIHVLLGNGDGTFQAQHSYPGAGYGWSLAVGDFNGDGVPDIVEGNLAPRSNEAYATVLLGNGDGSFGSPVHDAVGVGSLGTSAPVYVAVADFNNDGNPDLLSLNNGAGSVSILIGNGDGTFQTQQSYTAAGNPTFATIGDFNGDGGTDIAIPDIDHNTFNLLFNSQWTAKAMASKIAVSGLPATHTVIGAYSGDEASAPSISEAVNLVN